MNYQPKMNRRAFVIGSASEHNISKNRICYASGCAIHRAGNGVHLEIFLFGFREVVLVHPEVEVWREVD